jgi:hypothetical protein
MKSSVNKLRESFKEPVQKEIRIKLLSNKSFDSICCFFSKLMDTHEIDIFGDNPEDVCTCWVCFELFKDPTTLPCSHSMCRVGVEKTSLSYLTEKFLMNCF